MDYNKTAFAAIAALLLMPLAGALGFAPATVEVENVLKGGYAKVSFTAINTENAPAEFRVKIAGPIAEWAAVYPSESFTIPAKGKQKVDVIIQPPADSASGSYHARLLIETSLPSSVTGQTLAKVSTAVEGRIKVSLTNQQLLALAIESIDAAIIEEGSPAFLSVAATNTGNVRANPEISVRLVDPKSKTVTEFRRDGYELLPTESRVIDVQLPTEQLDAGDYELHARIVLGGQEIYSKALRLRILERGELSTQGEIVSVDAPSWAEAGEFVKVGVLFKNTGSIVSTGEIVGEVRLDGKIVELLSSKPVKVSPGEQIVMHAFFEPKRPGRHEIRAAVLFGGKQTDYTEAVVNVSSSTAAAGANDSLYYPLALIVIAAGLGYAYRDRLPEVRLKS